MSNFNDLLSISASGMRVERLRLEVAANNIANAHSVTGASGEPYRALRVVAYASGGLSQNFERRMNPTAQGAEVDPGALRGVGQVDVLPVASAPRQELDPGNPAADQKGFVRVPNINPVEEMMSVMTSVRAYEANVRVVSAAKALALKALEIGGNT
jgi:flagellar basal-body rod protein FlgC